MYTPGLGAGPGLVLPAAIVLPNTGSNSVIAIVATISLVVGVAITLSSVTRLVAKRAFKA